MEIFLTCLGVGSARKFQNCRGQGRQVTLCEGSFEEGTNDEMVQSEGGNRENKSDI